MKHIRLKAVAVAVAAGLAIGASFDSARADSVTIGLGAAINSIDPHYHALTPNMAISQHIFDTLILVDEDLRLEPGLAESWEPIADGTWEFRLRQGVTFHDGSPFTAEDVKFSIERVGNLPDSPGPFTIFTRPITEVEIIDDHTVHIHSDGVYPLMPNQLSTIFIVSHEAGDAETTAYNSGEAAIGTGPYKFADYIPDDRVVLERNDDYWGGAEPWERVTFRFISSAATRVAALKAGDVDVIDAVPTVDVEDLENDPGIQVARKAGVRNIYLYLDQFREETPYVRAKDGSPLDVNPLQDQRVRKALSMAINRPGIVDRVMQGVAVESGQFLPVGTMGATEEISFEAYDSDGARELLAEAGYPDGFQITLHGPNDRYVNDARIIQAIAQMWTRIGVDTEVEALPLSVFFSQAAQDAYSVGLMGWGTASGEPESPMLALIATRNPDRGWGVFNRSGYSSETFDELLQKALTTIDDDERESLYIEATRVAMDDVAIIPLHHQVNVWAMREGLTYNARNDERSMAMELRPTE